MNTMNRDDIALEAMIAQTQFGHNQSEEFWFSRQKQKQYIFAVGAKMMEFEDMDPGEAVRLAKSYVDEFYAQVMDPQAWKDR